MENWPADQVERRSIEALIPYARNSRVHSEEQVAQIAASMKEWGWTNPVLIDEDGGIIAGHGRVMAARKLGHDEAPCMVASGWTEGQKRAYVIADNKIALNSDWDEQALKAELVELQDLEFDLGLLGWGDDLPEFEPELDYGLLDEEDVDSLIDDMASGVRKAIQIEFEPDHYEDAFELVNIGFTGSELDLLMIDADFAPGSEDDQGKLDQLDPKMVCCPECGHSFDSRGNEQS